MVNKFNNKAAMELSLNLIIMLVIGLTVLGLVIGMVTGLLGSATHKFTDKLDETQAAEKEAVLGKSGFFAVGPEKVRVSQGKVNAKLFIKLNNRYSSDLNFVSKSLDFSGASTSFSDEDSTLTLTFSTIELGSNEAAGEQCQLRIQSAPVKILSQETQAIVIGIGTSDKCNVGDELFLTVNLADGGGQFDESQTINVLIE